MVERLAGMREAPGSGRGLPAALPGRVVLRALAAGLPQDPRTTAGAVAGQVGHGSPFAPSAAFERGHGVSPTATGSGWWPPP